MIANLITIMKQKLYFAVIIFQSLIVNTDYAQGMAVNSTGALALASAILDVSSTTQGMLIPRMDSAQRATISFPATGLLVYQTNGLNPGFYFYNGTAWVSLNSGITTLTGDVTASGSGIVPATISSGAVTSFKIASGTIVSGNIASGGVATGNIAVNAVTNTILAQMAPNTIKGNNTGAAANASDLSISQVQTMLGVTTASSTGNIQTFTAVGTATWTKPSGYGVNSLAFIEGWGGGGGGSSGWGGWSGGGGGSYKSVFILLSSLPSTVTVMIGAGGAGGTNPAGNGGATTFGSFLTAQGGTGSGSACGGAGGGFTTTANAGSSINDAGGEGYGGTGSSTAASGYFVGGGGGYSLSGSSIAGSSVYGGGGGGTPASAGGTSNYGGSGGNSGFAGQAPGGGGGADGVGGAGQVKVTIWNLQ